ncbi:MAG: hypothetical protein ACOYT8_06530 [Candidatus Dependentiae bacterium]
MRYLFFLVLPLYAQLLIGNNILTYEQYLKLKHPLPYEYSMEHNQNYLFYFGSNHSRDPHDAQYQKLKVFWEDFLKKTQSQNCIVLVEDRLRNLHNSLTTEQAIRGAGSVGGFITFLAQQNNIPVACPEPTNTLLFQKLLQKYTVEQLAYTLFAQAVLEWHRIIKIRDDLPFHIHIQSHLEYIQKELTFQCDLEDMKAFHKQLFNSEFNEHDEMFFYSITNPTIQDTAINNLCRDRSILRGRVIVDNIKKLFLEQGKNIFIVFGATHAVMQEPALRKMVL